MEILRVVRLVVAVCQKVVLLAAGPAPNRIGADRNGAPVGEVDVDELYINNATEGQPLSVCGRDIGQERKWWLWACWYSASFSKVPSRTPFFPHHQPPARHAAANHNHTRRGRVAAGLWLGFICTSFWRRKFRVGFVSAHK